MEGACGESEASSRFGRTTSTRWLAVCLLLALLSSTSPNLAAIDFGLEAIVEGPIQGFPGEPLTFFALSSRGNIVSYEWDFHDGSGEEGPITTHVFTAEGRYLVSLTVTGENGHQALSVHPVEIRNSPPQAIIIGPSDAIEDEPISFDGSGSSDPEGQGLRHRWILGDGGMALGSEVVHRYAMTGEYTVRMVVEDPHGAQAYSEHPVTVQNLPPKAHAMVPATLAEGEVGIFDASCSSDTPSDVPTLRYSWDFGDGRRAGGRGVTHAYNRSGVYRVTLTVLDDDDAVDEASMQVAVLNSPPTALLEAPSEVHEGSPFLVASATNDSEGDLALLAYRWSTGDKGESLVLTAWDEGPTDIGLVVEDDDGASTEANTRILATNVPPSAAITEVYSELTLGLAVAGVEGTPASMALVRSGRVVVASTSLVRRAGPPFAQSAILGPHRLRLDDRWTAVISLNSQSFPEGIWSAPVWLNLTFDDGSREVLNHVIIREVPATWVWTVEFNRLLKSHRLHAVGMVSDPGSDDLALTWALPDGTTPAFKALGQWGQPTQAATHQTFLLPSRAASKDADFPLTLRVSDGDGGAGSAEVFLHLRGGILTASNLFPAAEVVTHNAAPWEDELVSFVARAADSLEDESRLQYHWDFGDGFVSQGPSVDHAYRRAGNYQVRLTVSDGTLSSWFSIRMAIVNRIPTVTIDGPSSVFEDDPALFGAALGDTPGDLEGMRVGWDFGTGATAVGVAAEHRFSLAGLYPVRVWAIDDDGAVAAHVHEILVLNIPPRVSIRSTGVTDQDHPLLLEAEVVESAGDAPLVRHRWSMDGRVGVGPRLSWTPTPGKWMVVLEATDDDDEVGTAAVSLDVFHRTPLFKIPNLRLGGDGMMNTTFTTDGPIPPPSRLRWDYGEGNSGPAGDYTYTADGVYRLRLELLTDGNARTVAEAFVEVRLDRDGDGVGDEAEADLGGNPLLSDSDGDGRLDGTELKSAYPTLINQVDTDQDGLWDGYNILELGVYGELSLGTNPLAWDTDGDSLGDGAEVEIHGSNPTLADTDGDGLGDGLEATSRTLVLRVNGTWQARSILTLPYLPDSDGDGIRDDQEILGTSVWGVPTDPTVADTDGDGWIDGAEFYIREFAMEGRAPIGSWGYRTVVASHPGPVDSVEVRYATSGSDISALRVELGHEGRGGVVLRNGGGSGEHLHESKDVTGSFPGVGASGSYTLYVSAPSGGAVLEEFTVRFRLRTNPTEADTDGDSITDREELEHGRDGWMTDPINPDSDGDGWTDGREATIGTNPLLHDTDGDGVVDSLDIDPLANVVVSVGFSGVHHGAPWSTPKLAAVALVNYDGAQGRWDYVYATPHVVATQDPRCLLFDIAGLCLVSGSTTSVFNHRYYADVPDDRWSTTVRVQGWSINDLRADDLLVERTLVYHVGLGSYSETWSSSGGWINYDVGTVKLAKTKVLAVVDGNSTVVDEGGEIRYAAKERFNLILLKATSSHGSIREGTNLIVAPQSIFMHTHLRARINQGSTWPLDSFAFYDGDATKPSMTEGIAGFAAGEIPGDQASQVLEWVLRDTAGARRYSVVEVTSGIWRLNLPGDVIRIIPWVAPPNSPTGALPEGDFLAKISNSLVSAGQLIYGGLVALGSIVIQVAQAVGSWGMRLLGGIGEAWQRVEASLASASQVFTAALTWVVDWAVSIFRQAVGHLISAVLAASNDWSGDVATAAISADVLTADVLAESLFRLIFLTPLAFAVLAVVVGFSVAEKIVMPTTAGLAHAAGLVIGAVMGMILGLFITEIISEYAGSTLLQELVPDWFDELTGWSFTLAKLVLLFELKFAKATRPLASLTGIETSLYLSVISLLTLGVGAMIQRLQQDPAIRLKSKITIDAIALSIAVFGAVYGLRIAPTIIRFWYPLLFPTALALGTFSLITAAFKLGTDISELASLTS